MQFVEMNEFAKDKGFGVFDDSELVVGICAKGIAESYSNKDMKDLTEWLQRPQIGAKVWYMEVSGRYGSIKSTVGKFYSDEELKHWAEKIWCRKKVMSFLC